MPAPTVSEKDLPPSVHLAQPGEQAKTLPPETASGTAPQDTSQSQVTLTIAPPETAGLPAPARSAPHAEVDAPFVFRASDMPPASAPDLGAGTLPLSRPTSPVPVLTLAEGPPERKGVMGKVKGFFSSIFK